MPRDLAPCGTPAAARRHHRRNEPLDEACLQAERQRMAESRGSTASNTQSPDRREVRNGLPEPRFYVYRGAGYDIFEAAQ